MKLTSLSMLPLCALAGLGVILAGSQAQAANNLYQWKGGTSSDWTTAANWATGAGIAAGPAQTGGTFGHELSVTNAPGFECVYDASLGNTIYANTTVGSHRGLVIGSGKPGQMRITGGSFSTVGSLALDVVGNGTPAPTGTLILDGGNYTSGTPGLSFGVLGSGYGNLIISNGTATVTTLMMDSRCATISLDGGTLIMNQMTLSGSIFNSNCTNIYKFNGGTLKAGPNAVGTSFFPGSSGNVVQSHVRGGGAVIDTSGLDITIVQALLHSSIPGDDALDGGLTKNGAGSLTLTANSTYTGPTIVNAGSLVLAGATNTSAIRVNAGALTAKLPLSACSSLTLADSAALNLTVSTNVWSLASMAVTNATLNVDYGALKGSSAAFNVANLSASGTTTINISGTDFPVVNLPLLTYGSKTGTGSFVLGTMPAGMVATLVENNSSVVLQVTTASVRGINWVDGGDGTWQLGGGNWNASFDGTSTTYQDGDLAIFGDKYPTPGGGTANNANGTVTIQGTVQPGLVTVDNSAISWYYLLGNGKISGPGGLTKTGSKNLLVDTINDYTGVTTVNNGILYANNPNALGATNGGVVVANGGSLGVGSPFSPGPVTIAGETVTINGAGVNALGALRGGNAFANEWAGPVIVGGVDGRIGTETNGVLTVSGQITDNGLNYQLLIRPGPGGTVTISGANNTYGPTRTFGSAGSVIKLGVNNALSTNLLSLCVPTLDLCGFNQTVGGLKDIDAPGSMTNSGSLSTLTLNTGTNNYSTLAAIHGPVSLLKLGSGRQTLNSTNDYTGTTTVNGGELTVNGKLGATAITVNSGALLDGIGSVAGPVTVNANGTLQPGTSSSALAEVLTISNSLHLGGTTLIQIGKSGSTLTNDAIAGVTDITYGGTLLATNASAATLTAGNSFTLFAASGIKSGNFATVTILPASLNLIGIFDPATGQLTLANPVPVQPPTLRCTSTGTTFQFSWDGTFKLQVQTNSLNVGLSTNWTDYPAGGASPVTVPLNKANGSVFFRLVSP